MRGYIVCEAVGGSNQDARPSDTRQKVHGGAGVPYQVSSIVASDGGATALAVALDGRQILLAGYLAPALVRTASCFMLADSAGAPCALCGAGHGPGREILVIISDPDIARSFAMFERVVVSGALSLGPAGTSVLVATSLERETHVITDNEQVRSRNDAWRAAVLNRAPGPVPRACRSLPVVSGFDRLVPEPAAGIADTLVRNGRIHTMDASGTVAEAAAIREGRFIAIGTTADMEKYAGPETEIVDLDGGAAVPGLIDSHLHQVMLAFNLPSVNLLGARSIADVQALVAERAAQTAKGQWVIGSSGWHESLLAEGRMPTRWELDEAAPEHPVIIPRGGHVVTLNSRALERAGVTDETPDPRGGLIVRDKDSGEATGVLLETAAYFGRRVAPLFPKPEDMDRLLEQAMHELNSYGIVGVIDPVVDETTIEVYKRLRDDGRITVRSDLLYKVTNKAETDKAIAIMLAQDSDDFVRFPGMKFMADGGVEGARLRDPYKIVPGEQPNADYHGLLVLPPGGEEEFVDCLTAAATAGLQFQVHGVGDETIDMIARSFEAVAKKYDISGLRWCLMHAFLPSDAAIETLRRLNLPVTVQDHPVLLGHNQKRWWGDERAGDAIPVRRLIDAGLLVGGGTDGPVVPIDPFLSMWWMTTRQTLLGYVLGPGQAISAREALELYTVNNAKVLGVEHDRGTIEPGKLADMTVLSQDILEIDPNEIRNTRAVLTMVGGKVVYRHVR